MHVAYLTQLVCIEA